jgi:hypothetical protein
VLSFRIVMRRQSHTALHFRVDMCFLSTADLCPMQRNSGSSTELPTPCPQVCIERQIAQTSTGNHPRLTALNRKVLMAKRCTNPQCPVKCDAFGAGALYALQKVNTDRASHVEEFLWLCASCSARSILVTDADGSVLVVSKANTLTTSGSEGTRSIRLIFASPWVALPSHTTIWK